MEQKNEMMITFDSRSSNESFARVAVAAFTTQLNPRWLISRPLYLKQLQMQLFTDMTTR